MEKKTKKKAIEQSSVRKGSPMEGWGLWREGFNETTIQNVGYIAFHNQLV